MILRLRFFFLIYALARPFFLCAQDVRNTYMSQLSVPRLQPERHFVYTPGDGWWYSHHASITHFKDQFIVLWSNGWINEDTRGQRVVFSVSRDFVHWSAPRVLAAPDTLAADTASILTAAGFHQYGDTLVAYYGSYSSSRHHTHLWARISADGLHWSKPLDMHVPVNPNHGPEPTASGRLIISGNFCFPYTDDPRGLSGWKMSSFYPDSLYKEDNPGAFYAPAAALGLPPLCEGSFFQTRDGVLHMLLRVTGKGWKGRLWLTESKDNGSSWSFPVETGFTDNDSKFHFGAWPATARNTSTGGFYYVGIPDTLHHYARTPLVLSRSGDGHLFDRHFILADEPYILRKPGLWKGGQYGYPHTLIYKGYLYIVVSRLKESIEVMRVPDNADD